MKARLPQGMGGGPSNMQGMIKQAQKMQEDMARVQEELAATTYSATVGGGMVTATVDGSHELKELTIQPDAVDPDDVEMLQDLVMAAVNEALRKGEEAREATMNKMAPGMGGMGGLF